MAREEKKKLNINAVSENFDDANIEDVRVLINSDIAKTAYKVYTMVQLNSPCEVKTSKESYKKCADLLFD